MKKSPIILLVILGFLLLVGLSLGLALWQNTKIMNLEKEISEIESKDEEKTITTPETKESNETRESNSERTENFTDAAVTYKNNGITYTNNKYNFSLSIPTVWDKIKVENSLYEQTDLNRLLEEITISSTSNDKRLFRIRIAKAEDKNHHSVVDNPMTYINNNSEYYFYWASEVQYIGFPGHEGREWIDLKTEIQKIINSFIFVSDSNTYSFEDIKFDYPADWKIENKEENKDRQYSKFDFISNGISIEYRTPPNEIHFNSDPKLLENNGKIITTNDGKEYRVNYVVNDSDKNNFAGKHMYLFSVYEKYPENERANGFGLTYSSDKFDKNINNQFKEIYDSVR